MAKKTWTEKMNTKMLPKVERTDKKFADIPEGVDMLIVTPKIVDEYVRNIPEAVHTSLQQMRKDLAAAHDAAYSCPVTSGIALRIVSEKAYEDHQNGMPLEQITPFWRIIDKKSPLQKN